MASGVAGWYDAYMGKQKKKPEIPSDLNEWAKLMVERTTGEKNSAAVALGKLGGRKGGLVRASKLSARKRSEIAKKAAAARWAKQKGGQS
jgi:hypothetical protein